MSSKPSKTTTGPAPVVAPVELATVPAPKCNAPGCFRPPVNAGLCGGHYATRRDLAERG